MVAIRTAIEVADPKVIPTRGASAFSSGRRIRFFLHMGAGHYLGSQLRAMRADRCAFGLSSVGALSPLESSVGLWGFEGVSGVSVVFVSRALD